MNDFILILPFVVAAVFLSFLLIFYRTARARDASKQIRARVIEASKQGTMTLSKEDVRLFESEHEHLLETRLNDFFKDLAKKRGVQTSYFQKLTAGISAGAAMLIFGVSCFISFILLLFVINLDAVTSILLAIPGGVFLTIMVLRRHQNKREREFLSTFPLAFDIVARGLKAGGTIEKTFKTVAEQITGAVAVEFKRLNEEMDFGVPFEEALINAAERIQIDDFNFFSIALIIQKKAGGSLSELVANISAFLRKRQELRLKVKALSAEAKATGAIVGSLPVIILCVMYFVHPETLDILMHDPAGRKLSLFLIAYMATGVWVITKMTNIKV
jgi:tight adherence protein B